MQIATAFNIDLLRLGGSVVFILRLKKTSQLIFPLLVIGLGILAFDTTAKKQEATEEHMILAASPLKNINATPKSSNPTNLVILDDTLFFTAENSLYRDDEGKSTWFSDGTTAGTIQLKYRWAFTGTPVKTETSTFFYDNSSIYELDASGNLNYIYTGSYCATSIVPPVPVGNKIYFAENIYTCYPDTDYKSWLWSYDSISGQLDLLGESDNLYKRWWFENITAVNNLVFFTFEDSSGIELWKSNGTPNSITQVKDIVPGNASSNPDELVEVNNLLVFTATDPVYGRELWRSDGSEAGTYMVKDINPSGDANPTILTLANNILYFIAEDDNHGRELWRSDGTEAGTFLLQDIASGGFDSTPNFLIQVNDGIFFTATGNANENMLWFSNGTEAETKLVYTFPPHDISIFQLPVELNGQIYFVLAQGTSESQTYEIWQSDGTEKGTTMIYFLDQSPVLDLIIYDGNLVFSQKNGLWRSDSTTTELVPIKTTPNETFSPTELTDLNGLLLFTAGDEIHGRELWQSDGTESGTDLLIDLYPHNYSSDVAFFASKGNSIYLSANDGFTGQELWQSDGTEAGTTLLKDIFTGPNSSFPSYFINHQDTLFFVADDGIHGTQLWRSDGTETGTYLVRDIFDPFRGNPEFTSSSQFLFFTADDGEHGTELWRSDGTEEGTFLVKDINPDPHEASWPEKLTSGNNSIYFLADDGIHGRELWQSNGSEEGTHMVTDLNPSSSTQFFQNLVAVQDNVYFSILTDDNREVLWQSDGTATGTQPVKTFYSGNLTDFTAGNGLLFFLFIREQVVSDHEVAFVELWRSDGTASGTNSIITSELCLPETSFGTHSAQSIFDQTTDTLYFTFNDGINGIELWQSDGTPENTHLVKDFNLTPFISPYPEIMDPQKDYTDSSSPQLLTLGTNRLFFIAYDSHHDTRLWASDGTITGTTYVLETVDMDMNYYRYLDWLTAYKDTVVFSLDTQDSGTEPWIVRTLNKLTFFPYWPNDE